jgi:hypothetical protein
MPVTDRDLLLRLDEKVDQLIVIVSKHEERSTDQHRRIANLEKAAIAIVIGVLTAVIVGFL